MSDAIRLLVALTAVGWLMWWVFETPSRSQGRARAMVVCVVVLVLSCAGVKF